MAERGSLVRLQKEYDVEINWRGFELHPETPLGGMPLEDLFPAAQIELMTANLRRLAQAQGAGEITVGRRLSNTRRALAVAEFARDQGRLHEFRAEAMEAIWKTGSDLEDPEHLREVVLRAGLDGDAGLAAQDDPQYLARVDAVRAEAAEAGVTGVPTLFFEQGPVIVGAQPYAVLARAAEAVGATRRL